MTADGERETLASVWARRHHGPPRRRPALSRDAIVEVALRLADAEGLAAVSMRRIAAELDARTMSLYHHVARKEDVLALMVDTVSAEVLIQEPLPASWREAITLIARREREVASRHPWMSDVVGLQLEVGPNMLRHSEQTLAALAGLELTPDQALAVATAVDHYVLGVTVRERWTMVTSAAEDVDTVARLLGRSPVFADLAADGELPHLSAMMQAGHLRTADTFEQGLTWLLDGIERTLGRGRGQ
jgi:AcrR family transcriptional regulator